ncbi:putative toxin-antitoxin system, toxin component [Acetobacteraceae bacterium AT-5844]|nr:putative toxin-antitoxin system, toxin component [Acetobacteraceae bacterium AT-5844]
MADSVETGDFVISRVFQAPRQRVWDAWTRPEMLTRWFGPKGTATTVMRLELRPGGVMHARMDTADGARLWARFVYREVAPPTRLVWVHAFSNEQGELARSPFNGSWPMELLTVVTFEDTPGGTKVTLRWTPINATAEELANFEEAKPGMQGGWGGSFEVLDLYLAQPA